MFDVHIMHIFRQKWVRLAVVAQKLLTRRLVVCSKGFEIGPIPHPGTMANIKVFIGFPTKHVLILVVTVTQLGGRSKLSIVIYDIYFVRLATTSLAPTGNPHFRQFR